MVDINSFDLKPNFPIAGVAQLYAERPVKEAAMRTQQQQQLLQGLQMFGQGVDSLVERRQKMAQALTLGKLYGLNQSQANGLSPEQVTDYGKIQKGQIDMSTLFTLLHPGGIPGATPASSPVPASAQGPMLASDTTVTPNDASASMPVPIQAPQVNPKMVNPATFGAALKLGQANRTEPVVSQADALKTGSVPHGAHIINPTGTASDKKEQDAYYRDAVQGLRSIRGDQQVKDIEAQRNAAISAYNRLKQIQIEGKAPNPVDYADIVGQVYKARTGQAPTETILKKALQETATGKWGEAMTFLTGQQRPGTTKNIAASLMDMVAHMGFQADDLHQGVMQTHGAMVFNPNMSPENVAKLSKVSRGKSFSEATGAKLEDYDMHLKAIKWAQANPSDPRSQPILQKALQEKAASSGGSIGL